MAPVGEGRIALASRTLANADAAALACRRAGVSYAVACALMEKESGGRNIYGHDVGGALSTASGPVTVAGVTYPKGADIPVGRLNFGVFLLMIGAGARSNGVGPCQITYAGDLPDGRTGGYFRQMLDDEGLDPADPVDNVVKGLTTLGRLHDQYGSWATAGAVYNGGSHPSDRAVAYGIDLARRINAWRDRFAGL